MLINSSILTRLQHECSKSLSNHKHAAAIIYKGRAVTYGFNHWGMNISYHAEHSAIKNFLISRGFIGWISQYNINKHLPPKNIRKIMKKTKMIVIRFNNRLGESKPCKHCISLIKNMGIKSIVYSNNKGNFIKERIKDITNNHVSKISKKF